MRIYSMTATFGKLEHQTLVLQPGLNIITGPNEWGKSTWCAFITAMLYGIETRTHTTKNALADKDRYAPWSGSPMEGSMELHWKGKDITIQRTTKGRIPMGEFSAFETQTGLLVPELTAGTCGQLLTGVEKSVFERSAFLRGRDLTVEPDEILRRRLNGLVTTGDESSSADILEKKLRELKNRCKSNRTTGLIPQALEQKAELEQALSTLEELEQRQEQLLQQQKVFRKRYAMLENHAQNLAYTLSRNTSRRLAQAKEAEAAAQADYESICQECEDLPTSEDLDRQLEELRSMRKAQELLHGQLMDSVGNEDSASAGRDVRRYQRLHIATLLLTALTVLLTGLEACCVKTPGMFSFAIFLAILAGITLGIAVHLGQKRLALKAFYDYTEPDDWISQTVNRRELKQSLTVLSDKILSKTDGVGMTAQEQRLLQMRSRRQAQEDSRKELEQVRQLRSALEDAYQPTEPAPKPDRLEYTAAQTKELLNGCSNQLQQLHRQLGSCQGQMAVLGNKEDIRKELNTVTQRLSQLEDTYAALELAQTHLAGASAQLQRRFAPRITQSAQELFSRLTQDRYDRLSLDNELRLSTAAQDEISLRPALWRSEGTVDQIYLALRLAVARELAPECPLILDDALIRFDDRRIKYAVDVLRQEARTRQILLLTCQTREQNL